MTRGASSCHTATHRENWWHEHLLFRLKNGIAIPHPGEELEFEMFWKPQNRDAWKYELSRRLSALVISMQQTKIITELKPPSSEDLALLGRAKAYEHLDSRELKLLHLILLFGRWPRPVATSGDAAQRFGYYTNAIPPEHFDLLASNAAIAKHVLSWIRKEKELAGIPNTVKKGAKGGASRNADQVHQDVRWDHLDYLDNMESMPSKAKGARTILRRRLYKYAMQDAKRLVAAVAWMKRDREYPLLPADYPRIVNKFRP